MTASQCSSGSSQHASPHSSTSFQAPAGTGHNTLSWGFKNNTCVSGNGNPTVLKNYSDPIELQKEHFKHILLSLFPT